MSHETPETEAGEKEPIKSSLEELRLLASHDVPLDDPSKLALMEKLGIQFDSGPVIFEVENGERVRVNTDRRDFGTWFED